MLRVRWFCLFVYATGLQFVAGTADVLDGCPDISSAIAPTCHPRFNALPVKNEPRPNTTMICRFCLDDTVHRMQREVRVPPSAYGAL
jgi:hypothetical protein